MSLALYRRHKPKCKLAKAGIVATNCACPVWTYGTVNGRSVRRSLATRDWTHAHRRMAQLEAGSSNEVETPKPVAVTVAASIEAYLNDCEARQIAPSTYASYRNALSKFSAWCLSQKIVNVVSISLSTFSDYRMSQHIAVRTQQTELIILRQWCEFCVDHEWLKVNYAKKVKYPKAQNLNVTMPYTRDEVKRMMMTCHKCSDPARMRALLLTLLYSGLRIGDLIRLERSKLQSDGRLQLRMEKTGHPVYVRLPVACMEALNALPLTGAHFFWNPALHGIDSEIGMARISLRELGLAAGVADVKPHRCRDTFAVELLLAGVDIRTVQKLLGHTSLQTTEKHYAPWVTEMQAKLDDATAKLSF